MEQCVSTGCTNPAEVLKIQKADISMSSTSTQSERAVAICLTCHAQDKRMAELGTQ